MSFDRDAVRKAEEESRLLDDEAAMYTALTRMDIAVGNATLMQQIEAHKQGGSE